MTARIALLVFILALAGCSHGREECAMYGYERGARFAAETGASISDQTIVAASAQERCQRTPAWTPLD
jgi:hypothetical protein